MQSVIVIPARWASTRFPGKPLAPIAGKSLIRRVYERAASSKRAAAIYVATDDERIEGHVAEFGGRVVRPAGDFPTGTDRIAAALTIIETLEKSQFDLIVNVQGDEPLIDVPSLDRLMETMESSDADIGTLASPFESEDEFHSRDIVKVVTDLNVNALYFSRAPIGSSSTARRHVGVYAYRRDALHRFVKLPVAPLEQAESLEQLRGLQHGFRIVVSQTDKAHHGVDRPEDVARVESELARLPA